MNAHLTHSDLCDAITALARAQSHIARGELEDAADSMQLGVERALVAIESLSAAGYAPTLRTHFADRLRDAAAKLEQSEAPNQALQRKAG